MKSTLRTVPGRFAKSLTFDVYGPLGSDNRRRMTDRARVLLVWHVHGSWTQSLVAGPHRYLIPVSPAKDADGRGLR